MTRKTFRIGNTTFIQIPEFEEEQSIVLSESVWNTLARSILNDDNLNVTHLDDDETENLDMGAPRKKEKK